MAFDFDAFVNVWKKSQAARRFQYFHPTLTFTNSDNDCFVRPDGERCRELNPDSEALFGIGKEAYSRLAKGEELSKEDFDEGFAGYWKCIDEFREIICEMHTGGRLAVVGGEGEALIDFDIQQIDDIEIPSIWWKTFVPLTPEHVNSETKELYREFFLFHALHEVDNALTGIALDGREAIVAAIGAANSLANAISIESGSEKEQEIRRDMAYRSAMEKLKRDPKQKEKAFIRECWNEWQKKPDSYDSQAAFARDMLSKCEHLTSQKKIEDWCREWKQSTSSS